MNIYTLDIQSYWSVTSVLRIYCREKAKHTSQSSPQLKLIQTDLFNLCFVPDRYHDIKTIEPLYLAVLKVQLDPVHRRIDNGFHRIDKYTALLINPKNTHIPACPYIFTWKGQVDIGPVLRTIDVL